MTNFSLILYIGQKRNSEFPFFAVPGFQQGPCYRQSVFTRDRDTEFSTFIIARTQYRGHYNSSIRTKLPNCVSHSHPFEYDRVRSKLIGRYWTLTCSSV